MISADTASQTGNASLLITRSWLPRLRAPTFTGGASGAITLGTAFPEIYPQCYIYFAANVLEVGNAAGFYYCTMTSTTEGTVYNNTFTPTADAVPEVPATLVPFDDPIVGGAGVTTAVLFDKCTLPANLLNPQGVISFHGCVVVTPSNIDLDMNLDGSIPFIALSGVGADICIGQTVQLFAQGDDYVRAAQSFGGLFATASAAVDLTASHEINISMTAANATDICGLFNYSVMVDSR